MKNSKIVSVRPTRLGKAVILTTADKAQVFCTKEEFAGIQQCGADQINYSIESSYKDAAGNEVKYAEPRAIFQGVPFLGFGEKAKILADAGVKFTMD